MRAFQIKHFTGRSIVQLTLLVAFLLLGLPVLAQDAAAVPDSSESYIVEDEDVPYGVAAGYMVGRKLLEEGNVAEALPLLHMAYRAQPDVIDIAMDFQAALTAKGYFKDALAVVDQMVTLYPDSLDFLVERANLHLKTGAPEKALTDLRTLRSNGHVTYSIIDVEAQILAADGKTDQALDVYRDGLHLLPEQGSGLYLGMSGLLQNAGQDDRIPGLMDEALVDYRHVPRLWLVKSRALAAQGEDDAALKTAQDADTYFAGLAIAEAVDELGADPDAVPQAEAHPMRAANDLPPDSFVVELADFYAQRRELDKALGILQPLAATGELRLAPSLWLGRLLLGTGRTEEGVAVVSDILTRWPDSGRGWFLKGKATEGAGDWPNALPDFAHAVELEPRDPEIRLGYVRAMLVVWEADLTTTTPTEDQEAHRTEFRRHLMVASTLVPDQDMEGQLILGYGFKGVSDYERAVWRFGLASENPDLRMNALMQKSLCHDYLDELDKARADLETLHREFPDHPEVANSLGYFLAEKGLDLDFAAELVTSALAAEPGNGAFLDSMGWIHFRNGNLEQALDYMIQAVNVLPDDPVILEHLGMVLKAQGKPAEALDVLRRALARGGDQERLQTLITELEAAGSQGQ